MDEATTVSEPPDQAAIGDSGPPDEASSSADGLGEPTDTSSDPSAERTNDALEVIKRHPKLTLSCQIQE